MAANRWILSLAIVYHLIAVSIDALSSPQEILAAAAAPGGTGPAGVPRVDAAFTRAAAWVERVSPGLYRAVTPLRAATQPYIRNGRLRQKWNMFTNPVQGDQYLRMDHYVLSAVPLESPRVYRELIYPADREDWPRLVHDYRNKAVSRSLET